MVQEGQYRVLAISGEPGIGKTRLLSELAVVAARRGCTVLSGRGTELELEAPFAALVEALDDFLGSLPPVQLEGLGDRLPHLGGVFPAIGSRVEVRPGPAEERYRHHRAIGAMLEELAAARPLVLMLDDVHWADAASVEAIAHLLRRAPSARLLLVLCYRAGQASPVLIGALEAASRDGRSDELVLGTLTDSETAALLVGEGDAAQQRIFAESGGNPFYIEQLRRAGAGDPEVAGAGPVAGQATVQIPPAVLAAIRQELRYLPDPALRMLEGAAVAGEPFEPALAAEAADVDPERALELLDELVARDLVRAEPSARLFRFRQPIVRRAVYDSIPPGRRLAAHGRTANALGRLGARPAARAHHVALSARRGDDAAVDALTDAALEVADTAPASAANWLSVALSLMPAERTKRHLAMLASLAQVQTAAGAMDDARETLVTITGELPAGSGPVWSQAVATLATVELELGRHSGARRRLEAAVQAIEDPTSVQVVPLLLALAIDGAYQRGEFLRGTQACRRALDVAVRAGEPKMTVAARSMMAMLLESAGEIEAATDSARRAGEELDALSDDQVMQCLEVPYRLGMADSFLERYDEGARHLRRGIALAVASGNGQFIVPTRTFLA